MATVAITTPIMLAPTTPIIMTTTTLTTTPAMMGIPATSYRAAQILPIAPSVTSPMTLRPGHISAMMVSGILAYKLEKGAARTGRSFSMLETSMLDTRPEWVESSKLHILRAEHAILGGLHHHYARA